MELLQYLERERMGIQSKAARFFLQSLDMQDPVEIVRNLVGLVSGINSRIGGKIPAKYPQPLKNILENAFSRIRQAGGVIKIKQFSEQDYHDLANAEEKEFLTSCDNMRFSVTENGSEFLIETFKQ